MSETEKPSSAKFTGLAMFFHWVVFLLIAGNLILHPEIDDGGSLDLAADAVTFHMGVGLIILVLMIARLYWRLTHPVPALPDTVPVWQHKAARIVQWALYASVFAMVAVGISVAAYAPYASDAFGFIPLSWMATANIDTHEFLVEVHEVLRFVIIALFLVHAGAAIYHAVAKKDGVLSSMLPW